MPNPSAFMDNHTLFESSHGGTEGTLSLFVHVGGTRGVPSSTDNTLNRQARITLKVECIPVFLHVYVMCKYKDEYGSRLTLLFSIVLIVLMFRRHSLHGASSPGVANDRGKKILRSAATLRERRFHGWCHGWHRRGHPRLFRRSPAEAGPARYVNV